MTVKSNPSSAAQKWVSAMQQASTAYKEGVQNVKTAPGAVAAARSDIWVQNTIAAQAKFAANSQAVSLTEWQNAAINKGAQRLASGATAAEPKMQAFMNRFLPALANIVNALPTRGTFDQNVNRLTAYITAVHNLKGTL
jgi:hypothetical protein